MDEVEVSGAVREQQRQASLSVDRLCRHS
jgi:hypothetical protein